jgi:hypothetical protein
MRSDCRQARFVWKGATMKRSIIAATVLSLAFALPTLAIESNAPPDVPSKRPALTFDQQKAQILKRLDERKTKLQEEKVCVEAAKNEQDLRACRQKSGPSLGPGPKGRPGGPGAPGGPPSSQSQ